MRAEGLYALRFRDEELIILGSSVEDKKAFLEMMIEICRIRFLLGLLTKYVGGSRIG